MLQLALVFQLKEIVIHLEFMQNVLQIWVEIMHMMIQAILFQLQEVHLVEIHFL